MRARGAPLPPSRRSMRRRFCCCRCRRALRKVPFRCSKHERRPTKAGGVAAQPSEHAALAPPGTPSEALSEGACIARRRRTRRATSSAAATSAATAAAHPTTGAAMRAAAAPPSPPSPPSVRSSSVAAAAAAAAVLSPAASRCASVGWSLNPSNGPAIGCTPLEASGGSLAGGVWTLWPPTAAPSAGLPLAPAGAAPSVATGGAAAPAATTVGAAATGEAVGSAAGRGGATDGCELSDGTLGVRGWGTGDGHPAERFVDTAAARS
eukprot:283801-Chlamydomonas_euryale.AAC.1